MSAGKNLKTIGRHNIECLLKLLMVEKALSRKELGERLGLSKMTITNIVNQLKEKGYLYECKIERSTKASGPIPTVVSIVPKCIITVGVHITPTIITVQEVDIVDGVLYESRVAVDNIHSPQELSKTIREMLFMMFQERRKDYKSIVGIGISYSGIVNSKRGSIHFDTDQIEKEEIGLKGMLENAFQLPVIVSNEIEGAAIAELVFGDCIGPDKTYYINAGKRILGEFIEDYKIQHGLYGMYGELGHTSIKYDGPLCQCGARGCYDLYASMEVILQKSNCYSIEELQLKIQEREANALRVIEEYIQISTIVFVNIVNLYDPKYLCIGGEITKLDPSIFKKIERLVNERVICRKDRYVRILTSKMNVKADTIGAAMIIFEELFS